MTFLAIELCLTAICLAVSQARPGLGEAWFTALEARLAAFARNQARAVVAVGFLALGIRLALLPQLPIPHPKVVDEFGYLLLSDTLAHGRLANPTHPMWVHFETLLENWQPTYASMYYPGYGLFLAFGQVLLGHPFWGVWLSSGLMCMTVCWALYGWLPSGWALLGSLLVVIRVATFSYWVDSYWGGTVTALGGALVLGATARIRGQLRVRDAVWLGLGMTLLLYTRPYEGLFFCIPVLGALGVWIWRKKLAFGFPFVRLVVPAALIMALAAAGLGFYFWRITGSPLTTPYQVAMRNYGLVYFPWQKLTPVEFHHESMRMFYRGGAVAGWYAEAHEHPFKLQFMKLWVIWLFYFGPVLTMPLLAWGSMRRKMALEKSTSAHLRFLLLLCVTTYLACMLTIYVGQPHYVAHLTAVFYLVLLIMLRDLYHYGGPSGRFLARSVPLICCVLLTARVAAPIVHLTPKPSWIRTWCSQDEQNLQRAHILAQMEHTPGQHLVIVRYRPDHDFILDEWVFNKADIDGSKVIWARDMGTLNAELINYFPNRRAWLLQPDYDPPRLSPYVQ